MVRFFAMDLVYLQLSQLDVILGMKWLEFKHFDINYFFNTVMFLEIRGDG